MEVIGPCDYLKLLVFRFLTDHVMDHKWCAAGALLCDNPSRIYYVILVSLLKDCSFQAVGKQLLLSSFKFMPPECVGYVTLFVEC